MNISQALDAVDVERLYRHVLKLEGERHPVNTPEALLAAADYIASELRSYGASVRRQLFSVPDYHGPLYNIEGWLGDEGRPAAAIMNHYDTYAHTSGANDNAAAVAVMLEAARVLAQTDNVPSIRFLSFTLEEGNPGFYARIQQNARELGLVDERGRYTSYETVKALQAHDARARATWRLGMSLGAVFADVAEQLKGQMPAVVYQHLLVQAEVHKDMTFLPGTFGHIGSWRWMDEAQQLNKPLAYGICLDEIGRTYPGKGHQTFPTEIPREMLKTYRVELDDPNADWVFLLSDRAAARAAETFCGHCRAESINLPYVHLHIPLDYEAIKQQFPQTLGSDYTAFWREGIPALALFDSASWRTPYYGHTFADTADRLDYDQIGRITRAVTATLAERQLAEA
jgi:hypothetical protein